MDMIENEYKDLPGHLILSDRVYKLYSRQQKSDRAFDRDLVDFIVEAHNPLDAGDKWRTIVGMSWELSIDYRRNAPIPIEWVIFRFLCHHVRTNSIHILKGPGGEVLTESNFRDYLGKTTDNFLADEILRAVLISWVRTFPHEKVEFRDLFVSTDLTKDTLQQSINSLIFQEHIEESNNNSFLINNTIFREKRPISRAISLDRKSNRYFQEVLIQAKEPFCFIIMPFRKDEFDQSIYFDVIKPLIENTFNIECYRVDEDDLPDRIDNKIYTYLLRAAFIIAEVSTHNPNVMYELGIAHMLEKDCIILNKRPPSEMPFDINRISANPYEGKDQLRAYLTKTIAALAFKIKM
jgi:hypothetical protein